MSLDGSRKCVILDEADRITANTQDALRNFMEEYSKNASFILTCNHKNRIIEPIRNSRLSNVDFIFPSLTSKSSKKEALQLVANFFKRASQILKDENISFDEEVVIEITRKYYPDFRRTLNELQRHSRTGEINTSALALESSSNVSEVVEFLKDKDFTKVREWTSKNLDNDQTQIMHALYEDCKEWMQPKELAQLILILGKYIYQASFSTDPEINLMACLVEVMIECV
jgi:DNA polymerase III delta prime subunit